VTSRKPGRPAPFVPPSTLDPVVRALSYPYTAPEHDYVFAAGVARRVERLADADRDGRVPVLAVGSNRAPDQLARKFADMPEAVIAVERCWLAGFDVVFAAHISGYGAIAASLLDSPGTQCQVSITWLPPALMERMHATEGIGVHYDYARLEGIALAPLAGGAARSSVYGYFARFGALLIDGTPRALATTPARRRRYPALDQRAVQELAMQRLGDFRGGVEDFIRAHVDDVELRNAHEARLAWDSRMLRAPGLRIIDPN
jgi:hypothetical protein